jgi:hypothetical protein
MWVGSMTMEHVNYIMWGPKQSKNIVCVHMFRLMLEKLSGVILMTLFIGNILHPGIIQ